jgi:hypothetical protein
MRIRYNAEGRMINERGEYTSRRREQDRAEEQARIDAERAAFLAPSRRHHQPTKAISNMSTNEPRRNVLKAPPPRDAQEEHDAVRRQLDAAMLHTQLQVQAGRLTADEGRQVMQEINRRLHESMDVDEWVKMRESKDWPAIERAIRSYPNDGRDSRTYEQQMGAASRKMVATALSSAFMNDPEMKIPAADYLEAMRSTVRVEEDPALEPEYNAMGAALSVLDPDPIWRSTVEFREPDPVRLPENLTDKDMSWRAREYDRPNSPSARARMREEVAALKARNPGVTDKQIRDAMEKAHKDEWLMTTTTGAEKAPESKSHPMSVAGKVHYEPRQDTSAHEPPAAPSGDSQ